MKKAIVRFAALYVYNIAVLLVIGLVLPNVSVGVNAFWAAVILTLAALFLKPLLTRAFRSAAAKSVEERTRAGEKAVQYGLVYIVELIIWVATVWLSGVRATDFWAYAVPPLFLLLGWMIYDRVDDRLRAKAGELYDVVQSKVSGTTTRKDEAPTPESSATAAGRAELNDGLTPEQRRMLDELG